MEKLEALTQYYVDEYGYNEVEATKIAFEVLFGEED